MEQTDYLQALLRGDGAALDQLYRANFPMIRSLVFDHGGSEPDAKDVFQDGLIVVFKKAKEPGFELSSKFSTYFYAICRNIWFNRRRKKSATSEVTLPDDAKYIPDGDVALADADLLKLDRSKLLWQAFRQLGEDCQKVLDLFFRETDMETIAQEMGFGSEGYARRRKHVCKERLVELIKTSPVFPELMY